jgi:hypothetical protein
MPAVNQQGIKIIWKIYKKYQQKKLQLYTYKKQKNVRRNSNYTRQS